MTHDELDQAIQQGLRQGEKPSDLARRLGCQKKTVWRRLPEPAAGFPNGTHYGLWICDDCGMLARRPTPPDPEPVPCSRCGGDLGPSLAAWTLHARLDALLERLTEENHGKTPPRLAGTRAARDAAPGTGSPARLRPAAEAWKRPEPGCGAAREAEETRAAAPMSSRLAEAFAELARAAFAMAEAETENLKETNVPELVRRRTRYQKAVNALDRRLRRPLTYPELEQKT